MTSLQVYVETEPTVTGPVGLVQAATEECGSVIDQETDPLGIGAPVAPVTVVVRVVVPSKTGLAEAVRVINGLCFPIVFAETMLDAGA